MNARVENRMAAVVVICGGNNWVVDLCEAVRGSFGRRKNSAESSADYTKQSVSPNQSFSGKYSMLSMIDNEMQGSKLVAYLSNQGQARSLLKIVRMASSHPYL